MKRAATLFLMASALCTTAVNAAECIKESDVTKWEVIGSNRMVAYAGSRYLAFVSFHYFDLKVGEAITIRLFSPTICQWDTVILNSKQTSVSDVELIRQK